LTAGNAWWFCNKFNIRVEIHPVRALCKVRLMKGELLPKSTALRLDLELLYCHPDFAFRTNSPKYFLIQHRTSALHRIY
jgi:hypothetical protein